MGVTVIGPNEADFPFKEMFALLETKAAWSDDWQLNPALEPVRAERHTAGQGGWKLIFDHKYGKIKDVFEGVFATRAPQDLDRFWIRAKLFGADDPEGIAVWTGFVESEGREIKGNSVAQTGDQGFIAYGPDRILEKTDVYEAYWSVGGVATRLEWAPDFNIRGKHRNLTQLDLIGNRSSAKVGASYLFGGTDLWTNYDAAEYFLERFLNGTDKPVWTLGGQVDLLKNMTMRHSLPDSFSLAQVLAEIINPKFGMDYKIADTPAGFEIQIFALLGIEKSFGTYTMPKNPNSIRLQAAETSDLEVTLEFSKAQLYDRFRIIGKRTKSVFSCELYGTDFTRGWSSAMESAYKTAVGSNGVQNDLYRADDKFRDVYQSFVVLTSAAVLRNARPYLNLDGTRDQTRQGDQQTFDRATLSQLMLREGWDYTVNPPTNGNTAVEADFVPPLVIAYDRVTSRYCPVTKFPNLTTPAPGASVGVLENEWGIRLHAPFNHLFVTAAQWSGANAATAFNPASDGGFDYTQLVFTIAIENDQRLALGMDLPTSLNSGLGFTKVIEVPDAEYWFLAPRTIVGVNSAGQLTRSPNVGIELRNDTDVLARYLAGCIARYLEERVRASGKLKRLAPWGDLLGQILEAVEDGADINNIGAPVTSVSWDFQKRRMEILTGHATR